LKTFSFKRCNRLKTPLTFRKILYKGLLISFDFFEVRYIPETDENFSSIGITISKKAGIPVVRNRIKRTTREWFRLNKVYFLKPLKLVFRFKNKIEIGDIKKIPVQLTDKFKELNLLLRIK